MVHWKAPLPLLSRPGGPPQLWREIADDTVSNVATYDLTWTEDLARLWVRITQFTPVDNGTRLRVRTSGDRGSTFDSGASDYNRQATGRGSALGLGFTTADDSILCQNIGSGVDVSNVAGYGISADFYVFNPFEAKRTHVIGHGVHRWSGGVNALGMQVSGMRLSSTRVDGFQLSFRSGNISTGRVQARGIVAHGAGS